MYEVSSPAVAEMEKILENTYRNINIGLVNELAILSIKWESVCGNGYRCGENKTVWIPGILSWSRAWWSLYSVGSVLSLMESKRIWISYFYDRIVHDD